MVIAIFKIKIKNILP